MARRTLIFAAAAALGGEVALVIYVTYVFFGFLTFGNGVTMGPASPGALQAAVIALNVGLAAILALGALILVLAGFGVVLNRAMQAVMMTVAALQLFITIVVTGVTGWTQFGVLGGVFLLVVGAMAVTMVTSDPPKPEPGPVEPAPGPKSSQPAVQAPAPSPLQNVG